MVVVVEQDPVVMEKLSSCMGRRYILKWEERERENGEESHSYKATIIHQEYGPLNRSYIT